MRGYRSDGTETLLILEKAKYSSNAPCNLISSRKLKRQLGIVRDSKRDSLVTIKEDYEVMAIEWTNDVAVIQTITPEKSKTIDKQMIYSAIQYQQMPEIPSNITTKGHFENTKQIATPGATPEPQIPEIESEEEEEDITIEGEMPLPLSTATQKQRNKQREQIPRAAKTQTDYKKLHTGKLNAYMMQKNILDFENLCLTAQKA
jgi:hypothetical protein